MNISVAPRTVGVAKFAGRRQLPPDGPGRAMMASGAGRTRTAGRRALPGRVITDPKAQKAMRGAARRRAAVDARAPNKKCQ